MQRKVIGGVLNNSECNVDIEKEKISNVELKEELFDLYIHKAVVRAINHLKQRGAEITDYTVLDFIQLHGLPSTMQDQEEYHILQATFAITYSSLMSYIDIIKKDRLKGIKL
jgi:hypothetical protein